MSALLNTIYLQHRRSLLWSVMRIVRDQHAAEDVAQESYIRLRKATEAGPVEHVEAFLHQTARNLAIDWVRRGKTRARFEPAHVDEHVIANVAEDLPSAEDRLIQQQRLQGFNAALAELPERTRQVWVLSRVEGWNYTRIAEHLGISANTVYGDMKRAMSHCVAAMAEIDQD